jgi:hypothetical protein
LWQEEKLGRFTRCRSMKRTGTMGITGTIMPIAMGMGTTGTAMVGIMGTSMASTVACRSFTRSCTKRRANWRR